MQDGFDTGGYVVGCKVGTPLRLSLLLSVPVWCALLPATAHAACSTNAPTTGQTVDCSGTNNTAVIAAAGATGVTVNVQNGASITGVAQTVAGGNAQYSSVRVNDASTVINAGSIIPTLAANQSRDYVGVNLNGSNAALVNTGTISVTNNTSLAGSAGYRLYGVISSASGNATFDNVTVTNRGTIDINQSGTGVARGVYAGEGINSMVVENFGTISLTRVGGAVNTTQVAVIDADDDTDALSVTNHAGATIRATGTNTFTVGGRAQEYSLVNDGTITNTNGRGALVFYGGADGAASDTEIVNSKSGIINGNVVISDGNPLASATAIGTPPAATQDTRNSSFENAGTVNGSITYASGAHELENSGTITGPISVFQTAAVGVGAASFTLTNSGIIGGDITITDRADSVNDITLQGTGFSGNIVAVNGTGSNTLTLAGVTNLASVQNFTNLNLRRSNVTVPGGVSLVNNATISTNVYGQGGTRAAPSTKIGTINGTLSLAGATTLAPTFTTVVRNGDVYQVASSVTGPGAANITLQQQQTALVRTSTVDTSDGRLLLVTNVRGANSVSGLNQPASSTLNALLTYNGSDPQVRALGALVQSYGTLAGVRDAANALAPIVDGAAVQTPINAVMQFHQQIDSRLDNYLFAQIPASGRSADLGVARPVPVYGALPANGAWIEAIGGGVNQSTVNQTRGYNAELVGAIGGYDRLIVPGIRVGGAFGYINTRVNQNDLVGSRQNIQTYQGLGYAAFEQDHYYIRGSAGYGGVDYQGVRQVAFAGFGDTAFSTHGGNVFTARGEGGVPFEYWSSLLVPYAAFTYSRLNQDAYAERSANGTAFAYGSASNNSERSEVGGKVVVPLVNMPVFSTLFPSGSVVALEGRAAYVHEFGNVAQTVSASFVGAGNVFIASGPVPNRDMIDYGVGLRMASGRVQIDVSYNGLARDTYLQQIGLIRARYLF